MWILIHCLRCRAPGKVMLPAIMPLHNDGAMEYKAAKLGGKRVQVQCFNQLLWPFVLNHGKICTRTGKWHRDSCANHAKRRPATYPKPIFNVAFGTQTRSWKSWSLSALAKEQYFCHWNAFGRFGIPSREKMLHMTFGMTKKCPAHVKQGNSRKILPKPYKTATRDLRQTTSDVAFGTQAKAEATVSRQRNSMPVRECKGLLGLDRNLEHSQTAERQRTVFSPEEQATCTNHKAQRQLPAYSGTSPGTSARGRRILEGYFVGPLADWKHAFGGNYQLSIFGKCHISQGPALTLIL